ncbi:MAG: hypothetical protein AAGA96_15015 [Verrucomicrobiota bacterium]
MTRATLTLLLTALPLSGWGINVDLPEWAETSDPAAYSLGGGLWPAELLPEGAPDMEEGGPGAVVDGAPTNPDGTPLTFFGPLTGPESGDGVNVAQEEVEPLPPLTGDLKNLYFSYAPADYLIDPQRLLTEQKSNDIKRFLEFHSDESEFPIYVMVLGETQKIPDDIDLQELHREWFSEQKVVMMVYFREHPERTQFYYNESVKSALPKSVFDRIQQNCLREGAVTDLAPDQVEKMAIELSIQLYWLSRLMSAEGSEAQALTEATSARDLPASADAPELLREYAPTIFLEESSRRALSILITVAAILACIVLIAAVGWVVIWLRGIDRVTGAPMIFPSFIAVKRLGGEFSGGNFVSMSFDINNLGDSSR